MDPRGLVDLALTENSLRHVFSSIMFCEAFVLFVLVPLVSGTSTPIITTPSGQLYGQVLVTPGNHTIDAFLGIPFGEKPVRFQKSIMKRNWTVVLNVSTYGLPCNTPKQVED